MTSARDETREPGTFEGSAGRIGLSVVRKHAERTLSGERVDYETEMPYQTGGTRWVKTSCVPDITDRGEILDASVRESGAQITRGELPEVIGDRSQLVQLLQNLIGNAIKFHNGKPPKVDVRAKFTDEWVFSVRDNGIGVDPKFHERIFEIFQRLHNSQEYPGTGIGLAVCRRVVHHHGGRIWVEF